jgi:two-component system, OmpR family, phosphate regulon sensor histidine kinase PhoR
VKVSGSWLSEVRRLFLVMFAGGLVGWVIGYPYVMVAVALFLLCCFWLRQMWKIRRWLSEPEEEPPESHGIWGVIYDRIYALQRENREARSQLQSSLDYLQDSFASMREGVVMLSEAGAIEWSNSSAERLLGLKYPTDRGQPLLNLVRFPEFHQYFLAGQFNETLQIVVPGDQEQVLQVEITPFGEGDKLVFVRDVTSIARLERMRRDFVGNVSHELRTPLTVIMGYIDTLLSTGVGSKAPMEKPLQQMQQQSRRMENLLKDLLWLSRIESVVAQEKLDQIDIAGLVEKLRDEMQENHSERSIVLQLDTRHKVLGDYRELDSAVSNLINNAIKYSAEDTPVIIGWREGEGEYLLSVIDQGIGIDSQHIPRLTERFYRVDSSRNAKTGGTGLGLAIVKHVVAAHDADLRISSQVDKGSTFTIAFKG